MSEDVFLELVQQYQALIFQHASYLLNDPDDARDVTQETFIKAWRYADQLHLKTVKAWLLKCAHNLCLDWLRRRKFQVPLASADDTEIEALIHDRKENAGFQSLPASPEAVCLAGERHRLVQQAIAELPLHFRTVVVMREIEGLSFEEIAEALGQPLGTVKSTMFRARRKLRAKLGDFVGR